MTPDIQLSDSEWELMKVLWELSPASVNDIAAQAQQVTQWHPKTVRTMLIRLHKKGIVSYVVHDGVQHYQPLFSREECESQATQSFLQRVFDGALTPMVAHFSRKQKLTPEEKAALLKLLDDDSERSNK
ncbi:MAG: BlaI/MecI/CopY family transcriptional regulator [Gammaproteobacteria bacterium]|jgi:BlaI family transcriptional regulator, penicillinase repressor|nr:MAG: BlaI/MecI/CopY family transcriptional regulator [Gammaproteobacteria bacterium]